MISCPRHRYDDQRLEQHADRESVHGETRSVDLDAENVYHAGRDFFLIPPRQAPMEFDVARTIGEGSFVLTRDTR